MSGEFQQHSSFSLIVVLFILLVIVGAAFLC
ncbi:YjcZ family sporulation protein [Paenisporosarcina indica]